MVEQAVMFTQHRRRIVELAAKKCPNSRRTSQRRPPSAPVRPGESALRRPGHAQVTPWSRPGRAQVRAGCARGPFGTRREWASGQLHQVPVHVPCADRAKTAESTARIQASLCGRPARIAKPAPQMGGARSPGARVCVHPPSPLPTSRVTMTLRTTAPPAGVCAPRVLGVKDPGC